MRAALVKKHAAFLVDERLQKLQFRFCELNLSSNGSHTGVRATSVQVGGSSNGATNAATRRVPRPPQVVLNSGRCNSLEISSKNDEAALQFADSGDVTGLALGEHGAGSVDFRRRNLQHFGSGADDQPEQLVVQLDHENAIFFVGLIPPRCQSACAGPSPE